MAAWSKRFDRRWRWISATVCGRPARYRTATSYGSPAGTVAELVLFTIRRSGGQRRGARALAHLRLDLGGDRGVVAEVLLGGLAALTDARLAVIDPRARLVEHAGGHAHVEQPTLARDALRREDLQLGDAERRRHLVLHDLDLHAPADDLGAILDRLDRTDIEADRRVELQRLAAGSCFGVSEDHPDLLAELVDEYHRCLGLRDAAGELAQRLAHESRLQAHVRVAHLALDLGARHECRDGVNDDEIHGTGADERVGDLEGLFAVVGLRDEELVDVHAADARPRGVEGVLGVDERGGAAALLDRGDGVQREGRLARGLRPVDLDHPTARVPADAERQIEGDGTARDRVDALAPRGAELHDRALPELLLDLQDRLVDRLGLLCHCHFVLTTAIRTPNGAGLLTPAPYSIRSRNCYQSTFSLRFGLTSSIVMGCMGARLPFFLSSRSS